MQTERSRPQARLSATAPSTCTFPPTPRPRSRYFTRPTTEQPYYDVSNEAWRERSFAPYPLAAWAEFTFDGVPIRLGMVVQTLARVTGVGGVYEPLVVTPGIGVRVEPEARILPLDGSPLPVRVTVHADHAAEGSVDLKLPEGWRSDPAQREFHLKSAGDTEPLVFSVSTTGDVAARAYAIEAVAHAAAKTTRSAGRASGIRACGLITSTSQPNCARARST